MEVKILHTAGFYPSMLAMRLPHKGIGDSTPEAIGENDLSLAHRLIKAGDEHSKAIRGIVAWLDINAPLYFWQEMNTYRIGCECLSSESTMHCECKGLLGEALQQAKAAIPSGHHQRRILAVSYQTLRRIWLQRRNHRLPEWHVLLGSISNLPYANQLIFVQ